MRALRSPALHMLLIGGSLFAVTLVRGGAGGGEKPRIEVAAHRLEITLASFVAENGRPPTRAERAALLDDLIDQEVLLQYALALGMDEHPAARRRLAQIAEFVEANPHEGRSPAELADAAVELGLHHGDLVVRRILIDSAKRLIRSVVLIQEPSREELAGYLVDHPQAFERPPRVRLSQVAVNVFKWPDSEARAGELLARIRGEGLSVAQALALGDGAFVPAELPALTEQALATKLGTGFAAEVIALPAGSWQGPVASRYGHHLVYVHERREAYLPPLAEIRDGVAQRLLHERADEWLEHRLRELRAEFEIVLPGGVEKVS